MSRLLFILVVYIIWTTSVAQQSKPLQFREEAFDFGAVKEDGGPVIHEFVFTNASSRPVKILSVQASCGCTTPGWSTDPVAPGKTGYVQASFNPKGRPGYFDKTLTVTTDLDANPILLRIKGTVSTANVGSHADFQVVNGSWKLKNGSFNLGKVHLKDEYTVRDFPFINSGQKAVSVIKVISPSYIKVDVQPASVKPGDRGNIKISYNGKLKNQYGFQSDNVAIVTDDELNPEKSFSVYATLEDYFPDMTPDELAKAPQLKLSTTSLDFGRVQPNTTVVREVAFTNTGKKELKIKSLQGNCSCVTAASEKTTLKPGESGTMKISFSAQDRKNTQTKAVTIYSNDPQGPVQRITFTAYVED